MFTGIVRGLCPIVRFEPHGTFCRLAVAQPGEMSHALQPGDSVAIDGICLTVTEVTGDAVAYDVIQSTLARTVVGEYALGRLVNVERSMKADGEIGGHEVSGHVDTTAVVERIESTPGNCCIFFRLPTAFGKYLFPRGFIAINGVSLTVSDCLDGGSLFSVWLIPETLRRTNLGNLVVGQRVNIEVQREVQVLVDTLEASVHRFLQGLLDQPDAHGDRAQAIATLARILLPQPATPRDPA